MRSYRYLEPGEDGITPVVRTLTEKEILANYFDDWAKRMRIAHKEDFIHEVACLEDWITLHWAWRVPIVWNFRDPHVPKDAVYVGRPSVYGNPYIIGKDGTRDEVVAKFRSLVQRMPVNLLKKAKAELRGKDLVCWCAPQACHADVWLELANALEGVPHD